MRHADIYESETTARSYYEHQVNVDKIDMQGLVMKTNTFVNEQTSIRIQ